MRISDWSSDVCSSDLFVKPPFARDPVGLGEFEHRADILLDRHAAKDRGLLGQIAEAEDRAAIHRQSRDVGAVEHDAPRVGLHQSHDRIEARSEEHTSELQSLMRISYDVFCLKK